MATITLEYNPQTEGTLELIYLSNIRNKKNTAKLKASFRLAHKAALCF